MDTNLLLAGGLAVAAVVIIVFIATMASMRMREASLRRKFGPEYERAVAETGGRRKATAVLAERTKRVAALDLKPVTEEERQRYVPAWQNVEAKFVDDPKAAVGGADQLVDQLLSGRGYAGEDFDQRAADLSVNHPHAVQDYRTAHEISTREADTEELRRAMLGYRSMFNELMAQGAPIQGAPIQGAPIQGAPIQ